MRGRFPLCVVQSDLQKQGFELAAYNRAGQLYVHQDGRKAYVITCGIYAVAVLRPHEEPLAWPLLDQMDRD